MMDLKRAVSIINGAAAGVLLFSVFAAAHEHEVNITDDGEYRYIKSDGIPEHAPGQFPNRGNPNTVSEQDYNFRVPLHPELAGQVTHMHGQPFCVAIDGVPFDPGTAEYFNNDRSSGWNYEAKSGKIDLGLDQYNAHVQPNGAYHYHGIPNEVPDASGLVGYAADGFPIHVISDARSSYRVKKGTRPDGPRGTYDGTFVQDYEYVSGLGTLDECNGMTDKSDNYLYVLTDSFPFVPRCWKGTPDPSFERHGGQGSGRGQQGSGQRGGMGQPPRPPEEAVNACRSKSEGSSCGFESPRGSVNGACAQLGGTLACRPEGGKGNSQR